jgi:16S rRNA (guanine527-N7)-methyltransferase
VITPALDAGLRDGLASLRLSLAPPQIAQLLAYLELIQKWNRVYNLTAVRDPAEMLTHHLLDSLAIVNPVRRQVKTRPAEVLDVGSGAGLPGIAIAICCPDIRVDCIDAVAKKAAFIRQAAAELELPNLEGLHGRVQESRRRYSLVACRAFASLVDFVAWSEDALANDGIWLAMKGRTPTAEIALLPDQVEMFHVEPLAVPGLDAERCIVWMKRRAA